MARRAKSRDGEGAGAGVDPRFRIINWIGIIDQLATTRANRILKGAGLPFPQFVVLNHFSHRPGEGKTVTGIADALQQPQPGVTKTVQKLRARGYLEARPSPDDKRVKLLFLTPKGRAAHARALARFGPELEALFTGWSASNLAALFEHLDRIKVYMDENR